MIPTSHFELLDLEPGFRIDAERLDNAYRSLQMRVHPDKFATSSGAERRAAMQWSVRANEAYTILKDPLKRAVHVLQLRGIDVAAENNTAMEPAFLIAQMEWREAVEDARDAKNGNELGRLMEQLRKDANLRYARLGALLESHADAPAAEAVRQLMFLEKVQTEIGDSIAALEDA